ncbi:MAG: tRNA pseudouridine(38-40) synthase TruA [Spirochaetaceae bacterium]|nr:MAG: tRNA pseudouridine(38-40) synthase TruA [Spirochaetaceae bacterium]
MSEKSPAGTILIRLAYDGSDFAGYQIQRRERTVQGELEAALERIHNHPIHTVCAGRTDAGVHAVGQYVSFESDHRGIPPESFAPALNSVLPRDISVLSSRRVPEGFHARYDARQRHYRYYLYVSPVVLPHRRRYAWRIPEMPLLDRLNADAAALVGCHDFRTFATVGEETGSTVRDLQYARFTGRSETIQFEIGASGFLRRMVRSILGTLIERERLRLRGEPVTGTMEDLVSGRRRDAAGTTAPAWGLFLHDVDYDV